METATPTALVPVKAAGLTQRQENFARLFVETGVATEAYRVAYCADGCSRATARVEAWRLLRNPKVATRVRELQDAAAERSARSTAALIAELEQMVDADPNELCRLDVGACRHCHGAGGAYQWRDPIELGAAMDAYLAALGGPKPLPVPDPAGGYGFDAGREPNPECSACDGAGVARVKYTSTADVSPGARRLLRGIELYPDGSVKRVLLHDQSALRIELHKLRGLHVERIESKSLNVNVDLPAGDLDAESLLAVYHGTRDR